MQPDEIAIKNYSENEINIHFQEDAITVNANEINPSLTKEITIDTSKQSIFKLVGSEKNALNNNHLYIYVPTLIGINADVYISNSLNLFEKKDGENVIYSQNIEKSGLVSIKLPEKTFSFDLTSSFYVYIKFNAGAGKIKTEFFFSTEHYIYASFSQYNFNLAPKAKAYILLKDVPEKNQVSIFADGGDLYERSSVDSVASLYTHFTEEGFSKQANLDFGPPKALASFYVVNTSDQIISIKLYTTFEVYQEETFNLGEKRIIAIAEKEQGAVTVVDGETSYMHFSVIRTSLGVFFSILIHPSLSHPMQ